MPWQVKDADGTVHTYMRKPENSKAMFVPAPDDRTCFRCIHSTFLKREIGTFGLLTVGTCALGGPRPADGCSDVGAGETCERFHSKDDP